VPPDISKEMEEISDHGDRRREKFIGRLFKQRYADGNSSYQFVEILYGGNDGWSSRMITDRQLACKPRAPGTKILF
jgi:hypothetical protein